jgi:AraC-like DNA-binding protein/TolB-like protein/Tfp pilus assembly protein PilF
MTVFLPDEQSYIDRLTALVEENFHNSNFGVAELAREMGISHTTLHRKLKAIAQQSVSQFIRETRLKRAMELLQLQAGSVAEVAYGVGFGSTTYFSKCFHDFYGFPPGEVRKRYTSGIRTQEKTGKETDTDTDTDNRIESIAVLPFDNFTGDSSLDYLVAGMHDALIGEIGQLGSIRVISKTSVLACADSSKSAGDIANELGVDGIVEASVMVPENTFRLQIRLLKAIPNERQLWAQSFDVEMSNILKLYGQVARSISNEIHLTLSPDIKHRISDRREVNPECYKYYLRGKYSFYPETEDGMNEGLKYLHEAVRIDPGEPFAHAGLALGYMEIAHSPLDSGDAYQKAESAALEALKLDPNLAEIQLALAEISLYATWKFEQGEKYFKRALELNPYLSLAHFHYAWLLFLLGRDDEAVFHHELAVKYDPFHPMIVAEMGLLYTYLGRYDDALKEVNKALEIQENCSMAYYALGETYVKMGKLDLFLETNKKLAGLDPAWKWALGYSYAFTGHSKEAYQILEELLNSPMNGWFAFGMAGIYSLLGDMDEAYRWLAYEPHHAFLPWMTIKPLGTAFRKDERFGDFVKRLNLPQY